MGHGGAIKRRAATPCPHNPTITCRRCLAAPSETRPGALAEAAAAPAPLEPGQLAAPAPPAAGAGLAAGPKAEAPPAQGEQAPAIQAQPANGAAAPPAAWLAGEFAARLKESRSASSLSEASSVARQRKAGTSGTGARWTSYEHAAAPPKPCTAAAPSPPATPAEALSAAVVATALLRLLVAALLAVLTAVAALGPGVAADSPGQMEGQEQQQQQQLGAWAWAGLAAAWQQQQQRLPPVANLVALDASIIAAAYLLLRAMPGLARARVGGMRCMGGQEGFAGPAQACSAETYGGVFSMLPVVQQSAPHRHLSLFCCTPRRRLATPRRRRAPAPACSCALRRWCRGWWTAWR